MEPLLAATVALGTILGTKTLEKTGEKIGETLFEKTKQFLTNLNAASPTTVTAIELAPEPPLNYSQIIPTIQAAAEKRPELMAQIQELAELGQQEPKIIPHIQTAINNLSQSNPSIVINSKLAEKIGNVIQGGNNTINQNF
ncbi:MAG TPA: hypothetical protein IGS52_19360 [Oscillatoriaceae cyanobacterium M33_DOE_052]|uniref:Uncharacterized protein n=1 Tax=Planktothricoides sp. SpSt-374 TaxID=2282167 RepID=A0A7C3ZNA1_9CYAN|nr:hypothetical protein [Oscillatoriaceae cyanobacterium M33_DOE_052]